MPPDHRSPSELQGANTAPESPTSPETRTLSLGQALHVALLARQDGNVADAETMYRTILAQHPQHAPTCHALGDLLLFEGRIAESLPLLERALNADSRQVRYWHSAVAALFEADAFAKALELADRYLALNEADPVVHCQKARILFYQSLLTGPAEGNPLREQAHAALDRAEKLNAKLTDVHTMRAYLLYNEKKHSEGLREAQRAISLDTNDPRAHCALALLLRASGDEQGCQAAIANALALRPNHADALYLRGLSPGVRIEHAIDDLKKVLEIKPDHVIGHFYLGQIFHDAGAKGSACESMEKALQRAPNHLPSLVFLGELYRQQGKLDQAGSLAQRALILDPNNEQAIFLAALLADSAVRGDKARHILYSLLKANPGNAFALHKLGQLFMQQNLVAEGLSMLRKAVRKKPDNETMCITLIQALVGNGEYTEAEEQLAALGQRLQKRPSQNGTANYHMLRCMLAASRHNWDKAKQHYESAMEILGSSSAGNESYMHELMADNKAAHATQLMRAHLPKLSQGERPVTALIITARSATMFFHSLWDSHPQISTLPGVYFTAWFSPEVIGLLRPDMANPGWRQDLCNRVIKTYDPLFDPFSLGNVPGKPFGESNCIGTNQGLTSLGPDRDKALTIDREAFGRALFARLQLLSEVSHARLFELVHDAFDVATGRGTDPTRHIFYHIHNPSFTSSLGFMASCPKARVIQLVREPVQSLESWLLTSGFRGDTEITGSRKNIRAFINNQWCKQAGLIANMFRSLCYPFIDFATCGGVRMEDVKRHPHEIMPRVAEWMGVDDHPALYESTFGGLEYFGPSSTSTKIVSGFDTASIDHKRGRLFSERDIEIFDTLFWPFAHMYGYTDMDKAAFRARLRDIKPRLDKPLDFEQALYDRLPKPGGRFQTLYGFRQLHEVLKNAHAVLTRDETYEAMIPPLAVIR